MSLFEDTNPRELKELLGQIHGGTIALPDFQRDFVWEPGATQELIVSIANNYPAGSLLRVRNTHDLFAFREFQGAPAIADGKPTFLVLDGQQRLTSLYQAFFGDGDHRFFLRLAKLLDGDDFEEAIFHIRTSTRRARRLEDPSVQAQEMIMPLSILEGGAGGFGRWTRQMVRSLEIDNDSRVALEDQLADIEEGWIRRIDDYRFPVVTLSDETSADAVCTIFETLNRTGVKLSVFELLTARFWPRGINLRELWSQCKEEHPNIADFDIDPYYVLQAIALVARSAPSCKRSDVLDLRTADIEKWWNAAAHGLAQALQLLKEDCGVLVAKWLPYYTIIVPFAAVLAKRPLSPGPKAAADREKLVRWFWCSVFGQTYENAPNSQSARDVTEVIAWLEGRSMPETVSQFRFDPKLLRDTTARQRALYRGTICLILRNGARDFHSNRPISGDLIVENHIDDHHIFPSSFLKTNVPGLTQRVRDCVINRTLIDRTTNQRIGGNAPSEYLADIELARNGNDLARLLTSHFIDCDPNAPVWRDDFETFLNQRQAALWATIQEVTGATEASDLLEEEAA